MCIATKGFLPLSQYSIQNVQVYAPSRTKYWQIEEHRSKLFVMYPFNIQQVANCVSRTVAVSTIAVTGLCGFQH